MTNKKENKIITAGEAVKQFQKEIKGCDLKRKLSKVVIWKLFEIYAGENFVFNEDNRKVIYTILRYLSGDKNFNTYSLVTNHADLNKGILLHGPNGVGKSYLFKILHDIGNHLLEKGNHQLRFQKISASPFVDKYMREVMISSTNFNFESYYKGKLYIGDLGLESKVFGRTELFGKLLYERNRRNSKTFVTTNLKPSEINERYGDAIGDRLPEMFNIIKLEGESFRK